MKSYKDLVFYSTRYDCGKTLIMLSLYYHELIGKIEHEGEKKLGCWWLCTRQNIRQD